MREPFFAGQEFEHHGVQYRVLPGRPDVDGDLVIQFRVAGWHQPAIAHSLILTDFKFQIEENNYGKNGKVKRGKQGGWYLIEALKSACRQANGWRVVADRIAKERADKDDRETKSLNLIDETS